MPLTQDDTDGRISDKVVKLQVSRDDAADMAPRARSVPDDFDRVPIHDQLIGRILVDAQRLSPDDVDRVLERAQRDHLRFGDAAVKLGLVRVADVEFALARQFAFPCAEPGDGSLSQDLLAAFMPTHPAVEQLRALRGQIALRASGGPRPHPVVAVVSPNRGDGRSFVAANLAIVFAQLGQRTLLVDASLRNPVQHALFKLNPRAGLSTALAGRCALDCWQEIEAMRGLLVMPAGPVPPNSLELVEQARFRHLLDLAASQFEAVIVDTPAGAEGSDATLLANRAGAAVLVARAVATREPEARRFAVALEHSKTHVLGLVFNEKR